MKNGTIMFLVKLVSKKRNYFSIGRDYSNNLSIVVHSDTLFSAICNNFRKLYGKIELEKFLKEICQHETEESRLRISSSFHYIDVYKNNKITDTIFFVPRPLIRFPFTAEAQDYLDKNPKIFKKIDFISLEVANKLKENKQIDFSQYHILGRRYLVANEDLKKLGLDQFLSLLKDSNLNLEKIERIIRNKISIYEILDEQKVRIDRKTHESEPFMWSKLKLLISSYYLNEVERIDYKLVPGYYFIFDSSQLSPEINSKLRASITFIIDEGIGGRRSSGCGLVDDVEFIKLDNSFPYFDLFDSKDAGMFMNLSLVHPKLEDMKDIKFFNIFGRSGYIYSLETTSERFNDIKFIEEGSLFKKKVRGSFIQVASDEFISKHHEVFKNGIGFYLNLGILEVE